MSGILHCNRKKSKPGDEVGFGAVQNGIVN
jgi:hypothetical protein